jgi:hypothetical protein
MLSPISAPDAKRRKRRDPFYLSPRGDIHQNIPENGKFGRERNSFGRKRFHRAVILFFAATSQMCRGLHGATPGEPKLSHHAKNIFSEK